jgi:hypothetical protein
LVLLLHLRHRQLWLGQGSWAQLVIIMIFISRALLRYRFAAFLIEIARPVTNHP